ncbi:TSUP family transporter [Antarcticirhabdus aurantiaca]|uniref:TSUP family transporter n=1 Tax=Antarcticirhabdus aurantiaca TaxID=2606717 RepID=A0ACD4NS53_9HYPH|nr:TSUP family transporter [Antarcticirhabdus aurantiaca]WAJ29715.1 TSUP family transporter [Jeongeuplla avenae]
MSPESFAGLSLLPPGMEPGTGLLMLLASFATSALTAAFGLGGGLALLAALSFVLPVAALIPVHGLVQLGSNVGRVVVQRRAVAWRVVPPFLAGGALGALLGARMVVTLPEPVLLTALGLFVLAITVLRLPRLAVIGPLGFAAAGFGTTFLTMFFGATGPLNAAVLSKTFADRMTLVGTLAAITAVQHALKGLAFLALGVALAPYAGLIAGMVAVGFLGTLAGTAWLRRTNEARFRQALTVLLVLVSLDLIRRGVTGLITG